MTRSFRRLRSPFAVVVAAATAVAVSGCGSQPGAGSPAVLGQPPDPGVVETTQPDAGIPEVPGSPPDAGVVVTVQPAEERALAEGDYEEVAEIRGISVEEVEAMVGVQGRLSSFADRAIDDPGVLEFRFTPGATGGELLVEPGFDATAAFPDLDRYPEIEVLEARLTSDQRLAIEGAITEALRAFIDPDTELAPPIFDGFATSYTIYLPTHDGLDIAEIRAALGSVASEATGVGDILIEVPEPTGRVLFADNARPSGD